jgi:hypothetical protein
VLSAHTADLQSSPGKLLIYPSTTLQSGIHLPVVAPELVFAK